MDMVKQLLILFLCLFSSALFAQQIASDSIYKKASFFKEGKTVYIRIYEAGSGDKTSHILISYGEEKTEFIEMRNLKETQSKTNAIRIHYVLAKFISQGYEILNSTSSGTENLRLTTYFLMSKEKTEE